MWALQLHRTHWYSPWQTCAWRMKYCELTSWTRCVLSRGGVFSACVDGLLFVSSWKIDVFVIRPLRVPRRPQWHSDVLGKAQWLLRGLCIFNTHYDRGTGRRSAKPPRGANQSTKCQRQVIRPTAKAWVFPNPTAYPPQNWGLIRLAVSSLLRYSVDSSFCAWWRFLSSSRYTAAGRTHPCCCCCDLLSYENMTVAVLRDLCCGNTMAADSC